MCVTWCSLARCMAGDGQIHGATPTTNKRTQLLFRKKYFELSACATLFDDCDALRRNTANASTGRHRRPTRGPVVLQNILYRVFNYERYTRDTTLVGHVTLLHAHCGAWCGVDIQPAAGFKRPRCAIVCGRSLRSTLPLPTPPRSHPACHLLGHLVCGHPRLFARRAAARPVLV